MSPFPSSCYSNTEQYLVYKLLYIVHYRSYCLVLRLGYNALQLRLPMSFLPRSDSCCHLSAVAWNCRLVTPAVPCLRQSLVTVPVALLLLLSPVPPSVILSIATVFSPRHPTPNLALFNLILTAFVPSSFLLSPTAELLLVCLVLFHGVYYCLLLLEVRRLGRMEGFKEGRSVSTPRASNQSCFAIRVTFLKNVYIRTRDPFS